MSSRGPYKKNWVFTINNWCIEDWQKVASLVPEGLATYCIAGKEVGTLTETPHLQCYAQFSVKKRLTSLQSLFGGNTWHFESQKAKKASLAADYCKKEGDWQEWGEMVDERQRTDLERFRDDVDEGVRDRLTLLREHDKVMALYPGYASEFLRRTAPIEEPPAHELRPWQSELWRLLRHRPHPRKIIFVVDKIGNGGKTWFAKYHRFHEKNSQYLRMSKEADMAAMLDVDKSIYFFDIPRAKQEYMSYAFVEMVKDGEVSSPKYQSSHMSFPIPHVVLFMNRDPDFSMLSADRYHVITI